MFSADLQLAPLLGRELVLKRALDTAKVQEAADYVIVDTAPSLGLLTLNAIVAADWILTPLPPDFLPLTGLKVLEDTLARVKASIPEAARRLPGGPE